MFGARAALPRIATLVATSLAALGALVPSGCGGSDWDPGSERDLLAREPVRRIEDVGLRTPERGTQWGRLGREGWDRVTHEDGQRRWALHSGREAKLSLPATSAAGRTLRLEAWVHPHGGARTEGARSVPIVVRLNGVELGSATLGPEPRVHAFAVEEGVWRRGENALAIAVREGEAFDPTKEAIALARIEQVTTGGEAGDAARPSRHAGGWSLPPGTGLAWSIESYSQARLALTCRSAGEGRLRIRFPRLRLEEDRRIEPGGEPFTAVVSGERVLELPVPTAPGMVVEAELSWESPAGAPLELTRAVVLDRAAVERPSIVLISIDTLAAGHTSLYGYPRATTPRLERFAREATVFENARTNAPWTMPSFVSLLTGLYPSSVSMDLGGWESRFLIRLPEGRWTLAEALSASGYETAGFVDMANLDERFGFAQGFEHFDASAAHNPIEDPAGGIRHVVPRALEWLDGLEDDAPFFLFLHAYDVHGPYLPDAPWQGRFHDDELSRAPDEMWAAALSHTFDSVPDYIARTPEGGGRVGVKTPSAPFIASYDEEILATDEALGELFDALEERGLLERSVVVVTADHGESTDDHRYFGHGLLYEEVLVVPLVVRLPDHLRSSRTPRRVERAVELVDLYPTLLALAGHAPRPHLHGRSLVEALGGAALAPRPTFSEGGVMRQSALAYDGWKLIESHPGTESLPWTMLTNPRLAPEWIEEHVPEVTGLPMTLENFNRITGSRTEPEVLALLDRLREELGGPEYELYDLTADPGETRDLFASEPRRREELMELLRVAKEKRAETEELLKASLVPLSPSDLEELNALGYVDTVDEE